MSSIDNQENKLPPYINGFLFAPKNHSCDLSPGWKTHFVNEFFLHCSSESKCDYIINGPSFFIIVGMAIHLQDEGDLKSISNHLYTKLIVSEKDFFDELDEINGRFTIIFRGLDGVVKILNDACGMRSVFYSKSIENTYSSHPSLLASVIKAEKNSYGVFLSKYSSYHLPGNVTTYDDIFQLIPNHYLDGNSKKLVRFFPRKDLECAKDISEKRKELSSQLSSQLKKLHGKYNLLCSISAGIDSRVTLSATRELSKQIDYFTYYGSKGKSKDILDVDMSVVSDISFNLNLNHEAFELPSSHSSQAIDLQAYFLKQSHVTHQASVSLEFIKRFKQKNYLHIRSNLLEIGRAFYREHYNLKEKKLTLDDAMLCYSGQNINDGDIASIFKSFFEEVSYDNLPSGYDPFDLFYWEYRMGVWHSLILLESDPAFNTFVLFNNRSFLKNLLSIPYDIRKENKFYLAMCDDNWPILSNWGVNDKYHATSSFDKDVHIPKNSVPLTKSEFISGSNIRDRKPELRFTKKDFSAIFHLTNSAPLKGDFVSLVTTIESTRANCLVINLRTPYANPKLTGRMGVVVEFDGEQVWAQDASSWKETQQIVIDINIGNHLLKITSIALKNCEPWSWGKAGCVIVERLSFV
ncbi:hypothetical protein [Aeromonas taiwanensis]|uniref:hypothetical protein n=2 Tax=Aeromonas taiwanensis TaxID=633417 RepID=UPI000A42FB8C|nr:hypothetical protein [Aeromonas taiwanensis]